MDYRELEARAARATGPERAAWERALRLLREADATQAEAAKLLIMGDMMRAGLVELIGGYERTRCVIETLKEELHAR